MIGLIKKDLLMIKNNYKNIIIVLAIYIFYSFQFEMNMYFLLPLMGLMICISTINYDDFNNWHTYAVSLPQGKSGVIKSKYITTISVILLLSIFSLLIDIIIGNFKGDLLIEESFGVCIGALFAMIFMMSILFPILFKYGAEKGRIAMISIGLGIFGLVMLVSKVIQLEIPKNLIIIFDLYSPIIIIVSSILMIAVSYIVSKKIYLKKEF
ncbi:MAG TPA: ABC-2 transporter permease [Erysipelotrichaceae bacterium]|nr:ABC-2 transporter permease [Erysipelotrichaceae bacterium]